MQHYWRNENLSKNIAIDGPAGAGKSTIAKKVAAKLGFIYVDTGAMYRAIALLTIRSGIDSADSAAVSKACENADITIKHVDGAQVVFLNDENVNDLIRTEKVSQMASVTSAYPAVRTKLVELQRRLSETTDIVMDGRDIGTVVLPNADLKVFLTASAHVRALRRLKELSAKGETHELSDIENEIMERDHRDMTREISPLKQADDAILVDTSDMSIDEVTDKILDLFAKKN